MIKFYRFQIKIYLIGIFNETVYSIQINILLKAPCPLIAVDSALVVFNWKSHGKPMKVQQALLYLFALFFVLSM